LISGSASRVPVSKSLRPEQEAQPGASIMGDRKMLLQHRKKMTEKLEEGIALALSGAGYIDQVVDSYWPQSKIQQQFGVGNQFQNSARQVRSLQRMQNAAAESKSLEGFRITGPRWRRRSASALQHCQHLRPFALRYCDEEIQAVDDIPRKRCSPGTHQRSA
jgi:hypothetical protein